MSEEEFFNRAINRICKDYDYNFANEFKLLFLKKEKEIERLQEDIGNYVNIVLHDRKEIDRLNNIINEVRKWLEEDYKHTEICDYPRYYLDKFEEILGSDKE